MVAQFRQLVAVDGLTIPEAGRRLGVNKNACIGKARRIGLKSVNQRVYTARVKSHHGDADMRYGPRCPIRLELGHFAPTNHTGRLMGDPPPGRTPWAQP